jgi:FlaG/FlaF family flagellin (archaellin)
MTFKDSRIDRVQVEAGIQHLAHCGKDVTRIVVTHHAFDTPQAVLGAVVAHNVVGRANMAMTGFISAGIDMILSGHLHVSGTGETTERYRLPGRAVLLVRAGTATSTRQRGEVNAFNVVRVDHHEVAIDCMVWRPQDGGFYGHLNRAVQTNGGWLVSPRACTGCAFLEGVTGGQNFSSVACRASVMMSTSRCGQTRGRLQAAGPVNRRYRNFHDAGDR